jgi:nitroreductase
MMEDRRKLVLDTWLFRHACKKFDASRAVSDKDFAVILEAGRLSPSSFGFEPWRFLVLQDRSLWERLRPACWGAQNCFNGASHFVVLLARKKADIMYDSDYIRYIMEDVHKLPSDIQEQRRRKYENFMRNDFQLLESDRTVFDWACRQCYIALANMLTAAALLGIDSCPVEGFVQRDAESILVEEGLLDLSHFGIAVMAGFGYRAAQPRFKTRQSAESVVQWY